MSDKRCTLHITHLEPFKDWLREIRQIPYRDGKGPWQVLQVLTRANGWQVVFKKANMPEHFSVNELLMPTVNRFYNHRKQYREESANVTTTTIVPDPESSCPW